MAETFDTCPSDVVRAPAERVWELLTNPRLLNWVDARLIDAPEHSLRAGDRVVFAATLGLRVTWSVLSLEPHRQLALDIALPFGMSNLETIVISPIDGPSASPIDGAECRVTFN